MAVWGRDEPLHLRLLRAHPAPRGLRVLGLVRRLRLWRLLAMGPQGSRVPEPAGQAARGHGCHRSRRRCPGRDRASGWWRVRTEQVLAALLDAVDDAVFKGRNHIYQGACPETKQERTRDPRCPQCRALVRLAASVAAYRVVVLEASA